MMSPRPIGRELKPVIQIRICQVSKVSLFQVQKLHTHQDFFFLDFIKIFFLLHHLFSKREVGSLLDEV